MTNKLFLYVMLAMAMANQKWYTSNSFSNTQLEFTREFLSKKKKRGVNAKRY